MIGDRVAILKYIVTNGKDKDTEQLEDIKKSNLSVVVWGMGDLANNVIRLLRNEGIKVDYVFTNIKSPNEKSIDGVQIIEDLGLLDIRINLVMGHSRYEYADEIKQKYGNIENVYMFSNPFSSHDNKTSFEFLNENIDRFQRIADIVEDDESKANLVAYINSRCNKDVHFIQKCDNNYFNNSVFSISDDESYADVGAYDGDTIRLFLHESDGCYKDIYAIEPEPNAYDRLSRYIDNNKINAELYNMGCYNEQTVLTFDNSIDTSSHIVHGGGGINIQVNRLDNILKGKRVSIIKICQQGPVKNILIGSTEILLKQKPKLAIVLGLDVDHLLDIPEVIKSINPEYRIYFRFLGKLPSRLTMFAI